MLVFDGRCANIPQAKVRAPRANNTLDGSPSLVSVLQDTEQGFVWKTVAMRQMVGKWQLQVKLAKMAAYIEKRFTTSATPTPAIPEQYPPAEEGMVQLVLAPTMQRIKRILPEQVGTLLTKEWIQKLSKDAKNKPNVTVALSYLEYLIRLQRDYEDMEKRYQVVRKQEFVNMPFSPDTQYYQLALLQEQAAALIHSWPLYNMHVPAKCTLPAHPSAIQILDMVEGYRVTEADAQISPAIRKLQTSTLNQMQLPLDMLLNPRPKWACLEDMRREVKDLQMQFAVTRQTFLSQLQQFAVPDKEDLCGHVAFVQYWVKQLYAYKDIVEQEVNFVLQFLLQVPDTPVCLIGIQPDQDALPHFFPVIYPFLQEPRDAEEYAEIADKLKVWRVKFKMNYDLMVEMFASMDKELEEQQLTPL